MCGVKGRRIIVLFKQKFDPLVYENVWSLSCQQSVFQRYHSEKHLWEFYPQHGGKSQLTLKLRHCHLCISLFSFLRHLTKWHCSHLLLLAVLLHRPCCGGRRYRSISPARPAHSSKLPHAAAAVHRWNIQTGRMETYVPLWRYQIFLKTQCRIGPKKHPWKNTLHIPSIHFDRTPDLWQTDTGR